MAYQCGVQNEGTKKMESLPSVRGKVLFEKKIKKIKNKKNKNQNKKNPPQKIR